MASRQPRATPSVELSVEGRSVRISNPDRVYFSARGETKLDLARYYVAVGDGIVRALAERPCMLHRFPRGVDSAKVHQKRLPAGAPEWVETVRVDFPSGRHAYELCVTNLASVVWAVQMSTVEFHPWNSRRGSIEQPDEWRIDLDPGPRCSFATVQRAARTAHEVLDEIGAVGWPKTSGGNGLHVYVRIEPRWGFADVRRAALAFAREVERRIPECVTTTWWRKDREDDKVFLDYNQNARDHTIACAYSVRGVREGTVSAPVAWTEIDDVAPQDFTIATMPDRFAQLGDLHAGIDDAVFSLEGLVAWAERDERDEGTTASRSG
jgi:DNA ligase D